MTTSSQAPAGADPGVSALADDLVRLVKVLSAARHHAARRHPGVEAGTYVLLHTLAAADEPVRVGELATRLHSDISTVSRQVVPLVDTGLVAREPDPDDGRAARLSLLPAGREAVAHAARTRAALLHGALAAWSGDDVARCSALVRRLTADLSAHLLAGDPASADGVPGDATCAQRPA